MHQQKKANSSVRWVVLLVAVGSLALVGGSSLRSMPPKVVDNTATKVSENLKLEGNPPPPPPPPPAQPTQPPSLPPPPPYDVSCIHAFAWLLNIYGIFSATFSASVDISTSGFVNATVAATGWKTTFNGIPYYGKVFSQSDVDTLNSRPNAATDFVSGHTTAVAGQYYEFGADIGFVTSSCSDGYWPPGPSCPSALGKGTVTFPVFLSAEYKSGL